MLPMPWLGAPWAGTSVLQTPGLHLLKMSPCFNPLFCKITFGIGPPENCSTRTSLLWHIDAECTSPEFPLEFEQENSDTYESYMMFMKSTTNCAVLAIFAPLDIGIYIHIAVGKSVAFWTSRDRKFVLEIVNMFRRVDFVGCFITSLIAQALTTLIVDFLKNDGKNQNV